MLERKVHLSIVAVAVTTALVGCEVSNEKELKDVENVDIVDTPLVCQHPDTIKVDSFGVPILDENGNQSCERVQLVCAGQDYDSIRHTCLAKDRHPNAPLEVADAIPSNIEEAEGDGKYATLFFWQEGLDETDVESDLIIHAWNTADCNSYDPARIDGSTQDPAANDYWSTDWTTGMKSDGYDPNYGLYWTFPVLEDHDDCFNFIIHRGSDKFPIESDMRGLLSEDPESKNYNADRMSYVAVGSTFSSPASVTPYYSEPGDPSDGVRAISPEMATHWFDTNTVLFNHVQNPETVRLYYSDSKPKLFPGEGYRGVDYVEFTRDEGALTDEQKARAKFRKDLTPYTATEEITPEMAKEMLRGRVAAIAIDDEGEMLAGNLVQTAGVLDAVYTMGEEDADEATLGITYDGSSVTASVWAPTAINVTLNLHNDGDYALTQQIPMTLDSDTGIWSYTGTRSELDRKLFQYEVDVHHYLDDEFVTNHVIDPYAISVTTNGRYARFVDMNDSDLKPDGWDGHMVPEIANPEDAVIYEGHIRDFSIMDESTSEEYRGKYMAFTEDGSAPVEHLKSLAAAGLTHFQVLPANDIASINETADERVNINSTVGDLCAVWDGYEVCSFAQEDVVIRDLLETLDPLGEQSKQLQIDLKGLDGFNWGYDPYVFNAPEGSYATNPEDTSRIVEMRAMVQALHEMGLRTSLDVVYNHTNSSGLWDNSVFDKIVPGYYHRLDIETGNVLTQTCCQDTAAENIMFAKFMTESLVSWAEHFKFDAFRFDLMNYLGKDDLVAAREAVKAVDADTYFYGEGWHDGIVQETGGTQTNMSGTGIGTFSDVQRDGVRYGALFQEAGNPSDVDLIRIGLAGNISEYVLLLQNGSFAPVGTLNKPGRSQNPADTINYVSKHDNETLYDQLQYGLADDLMADDRARAQVVAGSFPLLSQGIPFMQMGSDLLRSKSMDRNSYDSGDWLNRVDFTKQSNNWGVSLPIEVSDYDRAKELLADPRTMVSATEIDMASVAYQEFLTIRASSPLFRLTEGEQVIDRVGFHNVGSNQTHGVIVMSIDDGAGCINATKDFDGNCDPATDLRPDLDPNYDALVVVFNGTSSEQTMSVPTAAGFELHSVQQGSSDDVVASSSFSSDDDNGYFKVPAWTTAVFVKAQGEAQGEGLNAYATVGAPDIPPYEGSSIYLLGEMTTWDAKSEDLADYELEYLGNSIYSITMEVTAGTYKFKIAGYDWSYPNLGGTAEFEVGDTEVIEEVGGDPQVVIPADGDYTFTLYARDREMPELTIREAFKPDYGATTVYIRGTVNSGDGWNTDDPMQFIGDSTYVTSIYLTAGDYQFKFASEDWSTVNFGAGSGATLGTPLPLDGDGNVALSVTEDGEYLFSIDASDTDLPVVTVTKDEPTYSGADIHLRGFNGVWDAVDSNQFAYFGGGYYAIEVIANGDTEFKVAESNWGTPNFGATDIEVSRYNYGQPLMPVHGENSNMTSTVPSNTKLLFILHVADDTTHEATITVYDTVELY